MRNLTVTLLCLIFLTGDYCEAVARPSNSAPSHHSGANSPFDSREGGETIDDALQIIELPFYDTGATCDNVDDYDVVCPYGGFAPDVVYTWTASFTGSISIDLCGSEYDTKTYVYDSDFNHIACNDDYYVEGDECGTWVSFIEDCPVTEGVVYYVMVDGYGNDCGYYNLSIIESTPCVLSCPEDAQLEAEPPLVEDYVDTHNGGCDSDDPVFQSIESASFCGAGGWYLSNSSSVSDTDWFRIQASDNQVTIVVSSESGVILKVLEPGDCSDIVTTAFVTVHRCHERTIVIPCEPLSDLLIRMRSFHSSNPGEFTDNEFTYLLSFDGIVEPVKAKGRSLGDVKSIFR